MAGNVVKNVKTTMAYWQVLGRAVGSIGTHGRLEVEIGEQHRLNHGKTRWIRSGAGRQLQNTVCADLRQHDGRRRQYLLRHLRPPGELGVFPPRRLEWRRPPRDVRLNSKSRGRFDRLVGHDHRRGGRYLQHPLTRWPSRSCPRSGSCRSTSPPRAGRCATGSCCRSTRTRRCSRCSARRSAATAG